jgi:hypothetical protein
MDLRLRNNEVAGPFSAKPSGLRLFWHGSLSLLACRSLRICSLVAPRTRPKFLSAAMSIVFYRAVRALVWESVDGKVWLSYNSPEFLQQRHGLEAPPFGAIGNLLKTATD